MVRNLVLSPVMFGRSGRSLLFPQFGLAVDFGADKNKSLCLTSSSSSDFNVLMSCSQTRSGVVRRNTTRVNCTKHIKRFQCSVFALEHHIFSSLYLKFCFLICSFCDLYHWRFRNFPKTYQINLLHTPHWQGFNNRAFRLTSAPVSLNPI